jgi:hypothetical protein
VSLNLFFFIYKNEREGFLFRLRLKLFDLGVSDKAYFEFLR